MAHTAGKIIATYTLNEVTGIPTSFVSVNDITGNATAAGMQIPMTIRTDTKTTFEDVAGVDEAKVELNEVVEFLKNAD